MSETRFFYLNMVLTTFDKQNSRTFQEQITVFKDKDLFNKLSFFDPLLNSYWLKHSVESLTISLLRPRLLVSTTTLCKTATSYACSCISGKTKRN